MIVVTGAANGELDAAAHTLSKLTGRPTPPLAEVVAAGLKS